MRFSNSLLLVSLTFAEMVLSDRSTSKTSYGSASSSSTNPHSIPLLEAIAPQRRYKTDGMRISKAEREMKLIRYVLRTSRHDKRARPVGGESMPVNVTIRMNLYQVIDVVERSQYVVLYTWMTQIWHDELLRWNPEDFGNITSIILPYTDVWLPDTYLYNNLQMARESSERWIKVIVEMDTAKDPNRAFMTFRYPAIYQFTCHMNVKYFPFDKQKCTMVFGSWTYDATGIDFFAEKEQVAREDFTQSEEWALVSFRARKVYEKYACCPHPFALLFYDLVIQRRPLHYIINLIIPTIIISVISNIGFFMPASSGGERNEKISLGITTLLAMSILLLMVSDSMPTTSSTVPLIGWFLIGIMAQTSIATAATTFILLIHVRVVRGRRGRPVSPSIRRVFFGWINRVLKVELPFGEIDSSNDDHQDKRNGSTIIADFDGYSSTTGGEPDSHNPYVELRMDDSSPKLIPRSYACKNRSKPSTAASTDYSDFDYSAAPCCPRRRHRGRSRRGAQYESILIDPRKEWEWLALILDRLCLVLAILSIVGLSLGCGLIGFYRPQSLH